MIYSTARKLALSFRLRLSEKTVGFVNSKYTQKRRLVFKKMDKQIYDIVTRVYRKKDYDFFIERCRITPEFYADIPRLAKQFCKRTEFHNQGDDPSAEFCFCYKDFTEDNFSVNYRSVLQISKAADLFYIQHEFDIKNIDPEGITPVLDGFDSQAYTRSQFELDEVIGNYLVKQGLRRISQKELDEVIPDLEMPNGVDLFGSQMTVENALFRDIYGICEADNVK